MDRPSVASCQLGVSARGISGTDFGQNLDTELESASKQTGCCGVSGAVFETAEYDALGSRDSDHEEMMGVEVETIEDFTVVKRKRGRPRKIHNVGTAKSASKKHTRAKSNIIQNHNGPSTLWRTRIR